MACSLLHEQSRYDMKAEEGLRVGRDPAGAGTEAQ